MNNNTAFRDLFVISGPSGAGKGTILQRVIARDPRLVFSISATTRSPRREELEGIHYHFIDQERFTGMIQDGDFLEYAFVHGNYYGTPSGAVDEQLSRGLDVVLDIDVQGACQVMKTRPHSIFIFIAPPEMNPDILKSRLEGRGTEDPDKIRERIKTAIWEMGQASYYDYIIYNDQVDEAVEDLVSIIRASRLRVRDKKTFETSS